MYEAELNAVIHANGGVAEVEIDRNKVFIRIKDEGPEYLIWSWQCRKDIPLLRTVSVKWVWCRNGTSQYEKIC